MKTLFLTTGLVVSVLTTSVFGAASVRMGSTGMASGGGTLTTARAGSLRTAQSSKTVSSAPSTPSVSIASPTQNTNARLTFVSPVKGLDINKAKENATTKQELNNLGEQIEQLRTQLDAAEADSANKIKLEDVERKITEKITELGTSTTAKDTYSKAEVDALVTELQKKTPQIDDRGNLTWNDPNGTLFGTPPYWHIKTLDNSAPITNKVDIYGFYPSENTTLNNISSWASHICNNEFTSNMIGCCLRNYDSSGFFEISNTYHGYDIFWSKIIEDSNGRTLLQQRVATAEHNPSEFITNQFCGSSTNRNCWVIVDDTGSDGSGCPTITNLFVYSVISSSPIQLIGQDSLDNGIGFTYRFATDAPENVTNNFVTSFCGNRGEFWCKRVESSVPGASFAIRVREHGYGSEHQSYTTTMGTYETYATNEESPASYVQEAVCGTNNTNCYATYVNEIDPPMDSMLPKYVVQIFKKIVEETELPARLLY